MVTQSSDLCWPEDGTPAEDAERAMRIARALCDRLGATDACAHILFAALPHPTFFEPAMIEVAAAAGDKSDFAVVARVKRSPAFTARSAATFARILPVVLRRGPPEISLLAVRLHNPDDAIGGDTLTALATERRPSTDLRFAGIYYDSGEVIESFGST